MMGQMEIDPIRAEYFYENNDDKIKLNWFCYEYAFFLYSGIRKSVKLKKFKAQNDQEKIVQFCINFSKGMKESIFARLGKLTNEIVFHEESIEKHFPENTKTINMFILEVAAKEWDELLSGCEICPTRCISEMYKKCAFFDMLDENGHLK
jgi:hypothetical protein